MFRSRLARTAVLATLFVVARPLPSETADPLARLAEQFGEIYSQGRYADAAKVAAAMLDLLQKQRGPLDPDLAANLNNLGSLAYAQGMLREAEPLFRGALAIHEKLAGSQGVDVATVLYTLAGIYAETGRADEALALYERALGIRREKLGPRHPLVAETLNNVGFLHLAADRADAAERALDEALEIWRGSGGDAPFPAVTLANRAKLRQRQRRFDEAEQLYREALAVEERVFGAEHPEPATTRVSLGELYRLAGDAAGARRAWEEAAAVLERTLGPEDPLTIDSRERLAALMDAPSLVRFRILVVASREEAESCGAQLAKGEPFEALAHERSLDPSRSKGGLVRADPGDLNSILRDELLALPEGRPSEPFELPGGWAILERLGSY